jgi:cell division protein FtsI/penicillin-binding protein 2
VTDPVEGLIRSCKPCSIFGLTVRQLGATYMQIWHVVLSGECYGIEQVAESGGSILSETDGDAVQQGMGQGEMLVTPLLVVRFIAAIPLGTSTDRS